MKGKSLFERNGQDHYAAMTKDMLKTKGMNGDKGAVYALTVLY